MSDKTVDKQNVGEEALNERTNERTARLWVLQHGLHGRYERVEED